MRDEGLQRQEIMSNPHTALEKGKGIEVAEFVLRHRPDAVVTRETLVRRGPGYALEDAGVETVQTEASSIDECIRGLTGNDDANPGGSRFR